MSALTVPATGGAGLPITVTDTTKNQGSGSTVIASTTSFYLSTNSTYSAGDVFLGSRAVGILAQHHELRPDNVHDPPSDSSGQLLHRRQGR